MNLKQALVRIAELENLLAEATKGRRARRSDACLTYRDSLTDARGYDYASCGGAALPWMALSDRVSTLTDGKTQPVRLFYAGKMRSKTVPAGIADPNFSNGMKETRAMEMVRERLPLLQSLTQRMPEHAALLTEVEEALGQVEGVTLPNTSASAYVPSADW